MARIEIQLDDALVRDSLAGLLRAGANLHPAMDEIGAALVASTQQRFERGAGPDGNPWPRSLRATIEGGKTLVDSSRLLQSITHEASADGVTVGTNTIYAGTHQFGATIRAKGKALAFALPGGGFAVVQKVTIPARPFLGIDADDQREIGAILADHLRAAAPSLDGAP